MCAVHGFAIKNATLVVVARKVKVHQAAFVEFSAVLVCDVSSPDEPLRSKGCLERLLPGVYSFYIREWWGEIFK